MHSLVLEVVEPALHRERYPRQVSFPAHRADHAEPLELVLKDITGVLATHDEVMQQPGPASS
ncbi:MAG: hypothetical protein Q8L62_11790 [Candidatus Nitrotoga sp.]|nr:hypothetical protein [Candidatus Nitrotoga sp.]